MGALLPIRQVLYDILTADNGGQGNINMNQKLGVEMSNAIRKDGVTIVQAQSCVNQVVINKVAQAMRLIDELEPHFLEAEIVDTEPKQLPAPVTFDEFILQQLTAGVSLADFAEDTARHYVRSAVEHYGSEVACRRLRIRTKRMEALVHAET